MEFNDDGRGECDASGSTSLEDQVQNKEFTGKLKDEAPIEMVCK